MNRAAMRERAAAIRQALLTDPTRSSTVIAREFGVVPQTVSHHRRQLGLPRLTETAVGSKGLTDAIRQVLLADPQRSTTAIAQEFGVALATVQYHRNRLELARLRGQADRIRTMLAAEPWRTDTSIAATIGVSQSAVSSHRRRLGLPSSRRARKEHLAAISATRQSDDAAGIATRVKRVLSILRLIERQPAQWTRERLCERFNLSSRMIDKDLRILRSIGYDIRRHEGGYELAGEPPWPVEAHGS